MTRQSATPYKLVGLVRIREHCVFPWERPINGGPCVAKVGQTHCRECVAELQKLGYVPFSADREDDDTAQR